MLIALCSLVLGIEVHERVSVIDPPHPDIPDNLDPATKERYRKENEEFYLQKLGIGIPSGNEADLILAQIREKQKEANKEPKDYTLRKDSPSPYTMTPLPRMKPPEDFDVPEPPTQLPSSSQSLSIPTTSSQTSIILSYSVERTTGRSYLVFIRINDLQPGKYQCHLNNSVYPATIYDLGVVCKFPSLKKGYYEIDVSGQGFKRRNVGPMVVEGSSYGIVLFVVVVIASFALGFKFGVPYLRHFITTRKKQLE